MNGVRTASPNDCESQLKIQARDKSLAFHPGVSFSTMKPFAEELRKLGYPDPFVIDERTMDWSHFYLYVLFQAPQETRTEFSQEGSESAQLQEIRFLCTPVEFVFYLPGD